ncbi:MAG: hypothetical protein AAF706_03610 [Bacteroidota bacterium]
MNPHQKENHVVLLEEPEYRVDKWYDMEMGVEVGGLGLIICTISFSAWNSCNAGFRIVDENNEPLLPYRKKTNNRHSAHFTSELREYVDENQTSTTFHIIANCQYAKLQVRPSDKLSGPNGVELGAVLVNHTRGNSGIQDAAWNHRAISTMTAIPLVPNYQGGANTIFTYPQARVSQRVDDKSPKKSLKPLKKHSSQGND